jgi:transposase-like protein
LSMDMDDEPVEPRAEVERAPTTGRMSARSQRVEVITRGERRRRWSVEQKREIAAESLEPGVSPITVARRYGISSGQLYIWRRHLLEGLLGTSAQPVARFARVGLPRCGAPARTVAALSPPDRSLAPGLHRPDLDQDQHGALQGWAPRGERPTAKVPHRRWKTTTFLAALRLDRVSRRHDLRLP